MATLDQKKNTERLLFLASLKLFSEQSTYMIGELKFKLKQDFTTCIKQADGLIKFLERDLSPEDAEFVQTLTDMHMNMSLEMRRKANSYYDKPGYPELKST